MEPRPAPACRGEATLAAYLVCFLAGVWFDHVPKLTWHRFGHIHHELIARKKMEIKGKSSPTRMTLRNSNNSHADIERATLLTTK